MAKEFKYRGLSWDELSKTKPTDLENLVTARARRSLKRAKTLDKKIKNGIVSNAEGKTPDKPIKTHKRDIIVTPNMVNMKFAVYDGRAFQTIGVTPEMVGFYLGEFVDTRKRPVHSKAGIGATKSSKNVGKK